MEESAVLTLKHIRKTLAVLFAAFVCTVLLGGAAFASNAPADKPHTHTYSKYIYNKDATCTADGTKTAICTVCGKEKTVKAAGTALGHKYPKTHTVKKKATQSENGAEYLCCTRCGKLSGKKVIRRIASVTLSEKTLSCTGKANRPAVTVKDTAGNKLKEGTAYSVKVTGDTKKCGTYRLTVRFTGKYEGKTALHFKIIPAAPGNVVTKAGSGSVTLHWSKAKGAAGYLVYKYEPSQKKYVRIASLRTTTYTVKGLASLRKYYFRVKSFTPVSGNKTSCSPNVRITVCTRPAAPQIKSVKAGVKKVKLSWNKIAGTAGYQIAYSSSPDFPADNTEFKSIKSGSTVKTFLTKLSGGKKLYIKIRSYGVRDGKKIYSVYSPKSSATPRKKPGGSPVSSATQAAVVFDVRNNETVFSKNADMKMLPASMTKLVTACTALKYVSPDKVYTVGNEIYLVDPLYSLCGLQPGYRMSLYDLLCGMLMPSGCDAAYCIAAHVGKDVGGSGLSNREAVSYFCSLMNKFAKEIGMTSSHFDSPEGYERWSHYTTPADMAKLVKYALNNETVSGIVCHNTRNRTIASGQTLHFESTNRLLFPESMYYNPNVIGMKTGTTTVAGYCISVAYDDGMERLIVISMGNETNYDRYTSVNNILDWYTA